jgi:hypothetical protein
MRALSSAQKVATLACLAFGLFLTSKNLLLSIVDQREYGGTDLRARVIGARLLSSSENPYFYTQSEKTPAELYDPNLVSGGLTRVTYPPSLLSLQSAFNSIPYSTQRWLFWGIEWALFLSCLGVLASGMTPQRRSMFLAIGLIFYGGGYFWRLHLERGQYYILVAFLWASAIRLSVFRPALQGSLWGAASVLRPLNSAQFLIHFFSGQKRSSFTWAFVLTSALLLTVVFYGLPLWIDFFRSGSIWSLEIASHGYLERNFPAPFKNAHFSSVEGVSTISNVMSSFTTNTSLLNGLRIILKPSDASAGYLLLVPQALFLVFLAGQFFLIRRSKTSKAIRKRPELVVFYTVAFSFLTDMFMPVRFGYADILGLPLLGAAFLLLPPRTLVLFTTIAILSLAFGHLRAPSLGDWPTVFRFYGVCAAIVAALYSLPRETEQEVT